MKLHIYLNFNGNTDEAIKFYTKALNTKEPQILKYGDLPPNDNMPFDINDVKDLVLHSEIEVGDATIKFSDVMPNMEFVQGNNMSVTLTFDDEEEIEKVYKNLSDDARSIIMPLGKTMWAKKYAYFVDKFGVQWQLNHYDNVQFGN